MVVSVELKHYVPSVSEGGLRCFLTALTQKHSRHVQSELFTAGRENGSRNATLRRSTHSTISHPHLSIFHQILFFLITFIKQIQNSHCARFLFEIVIVSPLILYKTSLSLMNSFLLFFFYFSIPIPSFSRTYQKHVVGVVPRAS